MKLLAESLVQRGHEVVVLAFDRDEVAEENLSGVRVIRHRRIKGLTDTAQALTLMPQVVAAMRQWQGEVDLFHIYNLSPLPGAGLYKLLGGRKPIVATLNSYAGFCPIGVMTCPSTSCHFAQKVACLVKGRKTVHKVLAFPYAAIYPMLISLTKMGDRYIALSQVVKELYAAYGYAADRIEVIPNFVETKQHSSLASNVMREQYTFDVLYVGTLYPPKGVDTLIRAFSALTKDNTYLRLTIVGGGPQGQALQKLACELGADEQVFFAGEVPHENIWQYYQNADVFVHPAIWAEPFGRIILEAMQFNLPLIVSNAGAPPEIVGDAGLVFEKGNVDDLAQKLLLVYRDEKLRQRLSSNCSKVLQNYDRDKVIDRIIALYQQVLSGC